MRSSQSVTWDLLQYHRDIFICIASLMDHSDCFPVLVAILGMYTLMSNKQYYDALGTTGTIANTEGINSKCNTKMFNKLPLIFKFKSK